MWADHPLEAAMSRFDFEITGGPSETKIPTTAEVVIYVQYGSETSFGARTITSKLATEGEIDSDINALKKELDEVADAAKCALRERRGQ